MSSSVATDGIPPTDPETESNSSYDVLTEKTNDGGDFDTLLCPTLRDKLTPRRSPLFTNRSYTYGGAGFVDDGDRVSLHATKYATIESAGARSQDSLFLRRQFSEVRRSSGGRPIKEDGRREVDCEDRSDSSPSISPRRRPFDTLLWAIRAGARATVYYNPADVTAAIVTCGGLCPGLNDVVRSLVYKLTDYGVAEDNIMGIRFGFRGFYDRKCKPVSLSRNWVSNIHLQGGTVLGTSRGGADIREIVKKIDIWGVNMLFVVGGNGGNAGALAIHRRCVSDGVVCGVVAVPKSIDNDIEIIDKCFGFDTAVQEAQRALMAAKVEANSAFRGIGVVKVMGRQSGFIAVQASLASGLVDVCLIPEVRFTLDGETGLLSYVEKLLDQKGHCLICVAEGAGQDVCCVGSGALQTDASGNPVLQDVGTWLKNKLKVHFRDSDVKYIDPSYMIRTVEPLVTDRVYCKLLGHGAVHAAFAGYSGVTVGLVNTHHVLLPTSAVVKHARTVDPHGQLWNRLKTSNGQPEFT